MLWKINVLGIITNIIGLILILKGTSPLYVFLGLSTLITGNYTYGWLSGAKPSG